MLVKLEGPIDPSVSAITPSDGTRPTVLTLMAPWWRPPDEEVTQSYGFCFTGDGQVVLAASAPGLWNLPGGTIESGESPEEALVREVAEEACARVTALRYLAAQHVWDPENPSGRQGYYQSRWWARIELEEWDPRHEMIARVIVPAVEVVPSLFWAEKTIAARLLDLAVEADQGFALS
jgi:8-oxo-dGTP pyrophosphatase MutT (NUDIX family)